MSDEQINAALTAGGFSTLTPDSIGQVREYLKRNPGFKGVVPGAGTYKATSAFNRMAATPEATFLGNMGVAGTAGLPLLLTGQEGTDAFNAANEANPGSAMAGGAVGGLTATIGGGKLLAATKLAPWIAASPRAAALAGDLAYGSTYGFNTADEGQGLEGAAWGAGGALAGNAIDTGLTKAAGGAMRGVVNPSVDYLRSRGIPLTGGQMLGGWTKTLEDKATSIPVLGDLITKRRGEGLDAFGEAAFQEAGDAIGYPAKRTGAAGVDELKGAAGRAYDDATAGVSVPVDDRLRANVTTALDQAASLPPDLQRKFELAMSNRVLPVITEPQMSGEAYQQAVRGLKSYKAEATQPGFEADYRDLLSDAQEALTGAMTRHGGDRVVSGLQSADKTYRMTKVLEDAVKRARNGSRSGQVERFTPSQLTDAAEANRFSGTGAARPFYDLSKNGQEVLPSQVPDSGTPGRLLQYGLGAGLLGGAGGAEYGMSGDVSGTAKAASAIGALSLLNTKAGRKTLEKLLLDRFDPLRKAGDLTIKAAPYAGMFGRGAGATAGAYIGN